MSDLSDVAVLMPAFNGQADVERTLASFRETSAVHVLIVDDGSTPPIVAPAIEGMKVEILRMPKNGGIERWYSPTRAGASARSKGKGDKGRTRMPVGGSGNAWLQVYTEHG